MAGTEGVKAKLRGLIERRQLVVVVGSGVSRAVCPEAPGWRPLIESALEVCREKDVDEAWCQMVSGLLGMEQHTDMLLNAAELVHGKLTQHDSGDFLAWSSKALGELKPKHKGIIRTLAAFDVPILTTNYDDLIETVTGYRYVTWKDHHHIGRVLKGEDRRVLHLHGHWDRPDSMVLGIKSYEAVKGSAHTQAVMKALGVLKTFLFVGCGHDGMADPNVGNFLSWLKAFPGGGDHYWLLKADQALPQDGHLVPVPYGKQFSDLPKFLKSLLPTAQARAGGKKAAKKKTRGKSQTDVEKPVVKAKSNFADFPVSVSHYLERLTTETESLELLGLGRSLQVKLPIADAYVPLKTLLARSMTEKRLERFEEGVYEHECDVDLGDIFQTTRRLGHRGMVLLGEPGAGKTTGACQLAWRLASRQAMPEDLGLLPNMTPVLLRFRRLGSKLLAARTRILERFLKQETHGAQAPRGEQDPSSAIWNGEAGGVLWILDGLDEVTDPKARQRVSAWIQEALQQRRNDWFLVTCRFQGYFREGIPLGSDFVEFHVRPLDDAQTKRFVRDWYGAAYGRLIGDPDEAAARAGANSQALIEILYDKKSLGGRIRELSSNPLLLTILCIVYHEKQELPTGRAELYEDCVRVLLEHWRRELYDAKAGAGFKKYDAKAAQTVLARLAWWMHSEKDRTEAPLADVITEVEKGLSQVGARSGLGRDGEAFLRRMRDEAGILALSAEGKLGFLHLSFQEYLAAEHAAREGFGGELAPRVVESWWQEVALLSLRLARLCCEAFFAQLATTPLVETHPELVGRCFDEALFPDYGPFIRMLEELANEPRLGADRIRRRDVLLRLLETREMSDERFARVKERLLGGSREKGADFRLSADRKWILVPAGSFVMGADNIDDWERPPHEVSITKPFSLARFPVTNAQYRRYLEAIDDVREPEYWGDRRFNQDEQPVVGVCWAEALAYCEWVGGRLPTEAEWEFACRAGGTTDYCFGSDAAKLEQYAWFDDNSQNQTQPVGLKPANDWGFHDMHGNVWEWCSDWRNENYYARSPKKDPPGPDSGLDRVVRGGSWRSSAENCRSAFRNSRTPGFRYDYVGFRVARSSI